MNPHDLTELTIEETWASAFVDGEAVLSDHAGWSETVHEQLYFYTVTRQVLHGDAACGPEPFRTHRTRWAAIWARVDANSL
jgi:hypothetical protein